MEKLRCILLDEMKYDSDRMGIMLQEMIEHGVTQKRFDVFEKLLYALAGKDRRLRYKLMQETSNEFR